MNRAVLISLGVLLLIAGVTLAILIKKTGNDESQAASPTTPTSSTTSTSGGTLDRTAPTLPSGGPTLPGANGGDHPKDYVVGDIHVRDHRAGDKAPLDIPPNVHPANGRAIPAPLTTQISQHVFGVLKQCAVDLPKEVRGEKARLEGQIEISIQSGKTNITKATMQTRDVSESPAQVAFKSCMEQKSIGLTDSAPDEDDLDAYTINVSYAIP